jgi:hypothetical protein
VKLFEEVQVDEEGNIKRDKLPEETIRLKVELLLLRNHSNLKKVF